jgi:hypothetical protein
MTVATDPRKTGISAGPTLLASSAVAVSHTGNTNETTMATIALPVLGPNGGFDLVACWSYTSSGNGKTLKHKLGGTTFRSVVRSTGPQDNVRDIVRNRGSAASQFVALSLSASNSSGVQATMTENTATALNVTLTAQLASAAETVTLESYELWLLP